MCAIFGFVGNLSSHDLEKATNLMSHRGPDGYGFFNNNKISLGHRRLKIIDLSNNAKQPMTYADDRFIITFNGEIYNYLELKNILTKKGHKFQSLSDTEVIIASFAEWGKNCVNKFNGMWAFAIYDKKLDSLFFSRDRLGKKPFFYSLTENGEFIFASEMRAILSVIKKKDVNENLIRNFNSKTIFSYEASTNTLFRNINKVPAGSYGYFRNKKLVINKFWKVENELIKVSNDYNEQVKQFREIFEESCSLRMRSDVNLGITLSGGVDSSSVMSVSNFVNKKNFLGKGLDPFVASFSNTSYDEAFYANKVAQHCEKELNLVDIKLDNAFANLETFTYLNEDIYNTNITPYFLLYKKIKEKNISVTLDGHGADELFGGYSFDILQSFSDGGLNLKNFNTLSEIYLNTHPENEGKRLSYLKKIKLFSRNYLGSKILGRHIKKKNFDSFFNSALYVSSFETILPTLLRQYDRYSMASGVEIRMPFLDHRLVSFAFSIPWTSKLRNGFTKNIVRDSVSNLLPKDIIYRKAKIGLNPPLVDWYKSEVFRNFLLDTINSQSFKECTLIKPNKFQKMVTNNLNLNHQQIGEIWLSIFPYLWEKYYLRKVGS